MSKLDDIVNGKDWTDADVLKMEFQELMMEIINYPYFTPQGSVARTTAKEIAEQQRKKVEEL